MSKKNQSEKTAKEISEALNGGKRFISMLSDYGFKVTFANENDTTFLKRAIPALIRSYNPIRQLLFPKNEQVPVTKSSRGGLFDVFCVDERERRFIIEMQVKNLKYFIHRAKFYGVQQYNSLIKKGEYSFDDLRPIYVISIMDGVVHPDLEEYHHEACLRNQHGDLIDAQITHILVEMGKWKKTKEEVEQTNSDFDKLMYVMKTTEELMLADEHVELPAFFEEDWIQQALKSLDLSNMSPEERGMVEIRLMQNAQLEQYEKEQRQYTKELENRNEVLELRNKQIEKERLEKDQVIQEIEQARKQERLEKEQERQEKEQERLAKEQVIREKEQINQAREQERLEKEQMVERLNEVEQAAERNANLLLIETLLQINYSKEQIAALKEWDISYVEELIEAIEHLSRPD